MRPEVKANIGVGERLMFLRYADSSMDDEDKIFDPGQFVVVAGVTDEGGLQCFPTDPEGVIVSYEGDTLFEEEVLRLTYAPRSSVRTLPQ